MIVDEIATSTSASWMHECAFMSTIKHMKKLHLCISLFLSCLTYKFINFKRKRLIRSFSFTLYLTVSPTLGSALEPRGHLITVSNRHLSLLGVAVFGEVMWEFQCCVLSVMLIQKLPYDLAVIHFSFFLHLPEPVN